MLNFSRTQYKRLELDFHQISSLAEGARSLAICEGLAEAEIYESMQR